MEKQLIKNSSADKEEKIFLSSVYDKLKTASEKGYAQAGDFCTESEQERIRSLVFCDITEADFISKIKNAQRKMPAVNFRYDRSFSEIVRLSLPKDGKILHRDVLGSLMSLGIKRCKIGDIIVKNGVFFEVKSEIAPYVIQNLTKIRSYPVKAEIYEDEVEKTYEFSELFFTVSSLRADCIIGAIAKLSRDDAKELILSGKLFVNSKIFENPSKTLSEGDALSVRGIGKFLFSSVDGMTKKERMKITIKKYI